MTVYISAKVNPSDFLNRLCHVWRSASRRGSKLYPPPVVGTYTTTESSSLVSLVSFEQLGHKPLNDACALYICPSEKASFWSTKLAVAVVAGDGGGRPVAAGSPDIAVASRIRNWRFPRHSAAPRTKYPVAERPEERFSYLRRGSSDCAAKIPGTQVAH